MALTYLTVFKARLGTCNIALDLTGFAHQPTQALSRRLGEALARTIDVPVGPESAGVLEYLAEKQLVTSNIRASGRYKGLRFCGDAAPWRAVCDKTGRRLNQLPVFETDFWLSAPAVPSTVGVPTPQNVTEALELPFQLRLLSRSKNTWTSGGHLLSALREVDNERPEPQNPFLLGADGIGYLRQLLSEDGILLQELLRTIRDLPSRFSRDDVSARFHEVVDRSLARAHEAGVKGTELKELRAFRDLISSTADRARRRSGATGPGVLEHRVAPRLEWLTDLGYLTKAGLARNGFEYRTEDALSRLLDVLDAGEGDPRAADDIATHEWISAPHWKGPRDRVRSPKPAQAYGLAYDALKRRIGPTPLREVAFVAALLLGAHSATQVRSDLVDLAGQYDGISLAGGRFTREPENIVMSGSAVTELIS